MGTQNAAASDAQEQQELDIIKAAYLRNVLNYAHWQKGTFENSNSSFSIAVAGKESSLTTTLRQAFGKLQFRIGNRPARLTLFDTPEDLKVSLSEKDNQYQVLYIQESEGERLKDWIDAVGDKPTLLFSDLPQFLEKGGDIALSPNPKVEKRFIYTIHLPHLKKRGIRLENEFLRLRSVVKTISK